MVIHSVWQWPAKLVEEYNILCRVSKNKQVFAKYRRRNLAFQANGTAYSKAEECGTAWCIREIIDNLVYWSIMCLKIWREIERFEQIVSEADPERF